MKDEKEQLREWAKRWQETGKVLEELRREEIRNSDLTKTIPLFDSAFRSALWLDPVKPYSGLVEYHKILKRLK